MQAGRRQDADSGQMSAPGGSERILLVDDEVLSHGRMTKPFTIGELAQQVRAVLDASSAATG